MDSHIFQSFIALNFYRVSIDQNLLNCFWLNCRCCSMVEYLVAYHPSYLSPHFSAISLHFCIQRMRFFYFFICLCCSCFLKRKMLHHFSYFVSTLQKQNVERAKLALLNEKLDESSDLNDAERQSDHLLMMVAYRKWEKIFREVCEWLWYVF